MADMIVSGAGTTAVNGTYVEIGTYNGKPTYYKGEESSIYWTGSSWFIWDSLNYDEKAYVSNDNVATPDLCTTWTATGIGALPVPTVTAAGGGDPPSSIINHIMHYRRLMSR